MTRVWLSSGSPRRHDLLLRVGFSVEVHPADIDENLLPGEAPVAAAQRLAGTKAARGPEDRVILAADTIVHLGDVVLGKPASRDENRGFLATLSGRWHEVTTGFCVRRGDDAIVASVTTEVRFRALDDSEIDAYVATGEGNDKAGGYAIQGVGGALIAAVRGSWTNVMGLPIEAVVEPLVARGASRWDR